MTATASRTLLDQVNHLPTLPKAVRELLAEFEKPQVEFDNVVRGLRADPVLSVKLLRLSNSAFYRRSGTVSRIEDAVVFLGLHAVRNLVLAIGLAAGVSFPPRFARKAFWRYSLHTAVIARQLAVQTSQDREAAFTLGLVRAIGVPLLYGTFPQEIEALDSGGSCFFDPDRGALEHARLGFNHLELTADLIEHWHLPAEAADALRQSQHPDTTDNQFRMAAILRIAGWLAAGLEEGQDLRDALPPELETLCSAVGIDDEELAAIPPIGELTAGLETLLE